MEPPIISSPADGCCPCAGPPPRRVPPVPRGPCPPPGPQRPEGARVSPLEPCCTCGTPGAELGLWRLSTGKAARGGGRNPAPGPPLRRCLRETRGPSCLHLLRIEGGSALERGVSVAQGRIAPRSDCRFSRASPTLGGREQSLPESRFWEVRLHNTWFCAEWEESHFK